MLDAGEITMSDSIDRLTRTDQICTAFDRAWSAGESPDLDAYLNQVDDFDRGELFRKLLEVEVEYRVARGEIPNTADYISRYQNFAEIVKEVFAECVDTESRAFQKTVVLQNQVVIDNPLDDRCDELEALNREIADYEFEGRIGSGGMGTVYRARHRQMERTVAMKMVRSEWFQSRHTHEERQRAIGMFHEEIRAASRLTHPNIVRVYDMDEANGRPLFTMEFIDGENLRERIERDGPFSNSEAAEAVAAIADAVHHAHQHFVLHRDIKPQNVLQESETKTLKIADFGLARVESKTDPSATDNSSGGIVGTPPYMAPELFDDETHEGSIATEVYAIGATLYELLTGRPPFRASSRDDLIDSICTQTPATPSTLCRGIAKQLDLICLKCLEKNPDDRYGSAAEIATELRKFLDAPKQTAHIGAMSRAFFGVAAAIFAINLAVFFLLPQLNDAVSRTSRVLWEVSVWALLFCMYPPVFIALGMIPRRPDRDNRQARIQLWAMWIGKFLAAGCFSWALRYQMQDPAAAIQLSYVAFAALSGMVLSSMAPLYWDGFYLAAAGFFGVAIAISIVPAWAPVVYGSYAASGVVAYGLNVRTVSQTYG